MELPSKQQILRGALVGGAALLAMRLTSGKSMLWQGAAVIVSVVAVTPLAAKVG